MKRLFPVIVAVVLLCGVLCHGAYADKDHAEILKLREKIIQVQNKGNLGIRNLLPCRSIQMFGTFEALPEARIREGETFLIYFEPANFNVVKKDGRYHVHLVQDLVVTDSEGSETLLERPAFATLNHSTEEPVLEYYFKNTLTRVPPGDYLFKVTLHDKLKGQTVEKVLPFTVSK